ncbi:MAG TPA: SprT family zinc-dependent metalloprotease [Dehalococcoidia bacterium]|nr:SprT family zinc-dependent metalloprotease [Dehalococcoidia bacterium]
MGETTERGRIEHGGRRIEYSVVRSRRRRRTIGITLAKDGGVVVRAPLRTPRGVVEDMVRRKAGWITRRQAEARRRPGPLQFVSGEEAPYLGEPRRLIVRQADTKRAALRFDGRSFDVRVPSGHDEGQSRAAVRRAMEAWFHGRAQELLEASVQQWAAAIRCAPGRVLVRNQKRQWGSCAPDGTLRFNWRIVMLDPSLIEYVVVHELMHLRVRNHSARFWAAVASVMPDFKERRRRLREAGSGLAL